MSQWTHVAATIRFDALRLPGIAVGRMTLADLGRTVQYDQPVTAWDACDVPCGSEGSLQTSLYEDPDTSNMAAYVATIWGDLRSYEDVEAIRAYLNRICRGRMVRQGVAIVNVEFKGTWILRCSTDEAGNNKWIIAQSTREKMA
jgi:hypothetical protein